MASHRYLMHGLLWFLHRDHHQKAGGNHLEKNDWFFVIFAIPGILLILRVHSRLLVITTCGWVLE
jgi:beta-carotene 3-hydroxylase